MSRGHVRAGLGSPFTSNSRRDSQAVLEEYRAVGDRLGPVRAVTYQKSCVAARTALGNDSGQSLLGCLVQGCLGLVE